MPSPRPLALAAVLLLSPGAVAADVLTPDMARTRVDHHLRYVAQLAEHFESLIADGCPALSAAAAWDRYVETETDRLVLLIAHQEQAWVEAKRTGDDEVRRAAKMPRAQKEHLRDLVEKFRTCAEANGVAFSPATVWRRVERELPSRQAEIALPR